MERAPPSDAPLIGKADAEEEEDSPHPAFAVRRCAIAVIFLFTAGNAASVDDALLRSVVACSAPISAPADSPDWSGSYLCGDRAEVLREATRVNGYLVSLSTVAHLVGGPPIAALADAAGGAFRMQALALSIALLVAARLLVFAAVLWASAAMQPPASEDESSSSTWLALPLPPLVTARVLLGAS